MSEPCDVIRVAIIVPKGSIRLSADSIIDLQEINKSH